MPSVWIVLTLPAVAPLWKFGDIKIEIVVGCGVRELRIRLRLAAVEFLKRRGRDRTQFIKQAFVHLESVKLETLRTLPPSQQQPRVTGKVDLHRARHDFSLRELWTRNRPNETT